MNKTKKRAAKRNTKRFVAKNLHYWASKGWVTSTHFLQTTEMSCAAANSFIMHTALAAYMAETRRKDASTFNWTFPLDDLHKIANLKCYRTFHGCTLGEAKTAVEAAMEFTQPTLDDLEF